MSAAHSAFDLRRTRLGFIRLTADPLVAKQLIETKKVRIGEEGASDNLLLTEVLWLKKAAMVGSSYKLRFCFSARSLFRLSMI